MKNLLEDFILTGNIGPLAIGHQVNFSEGKWIESIATHSNGIPELYQCLLSDLMINVGVNDKNKVEYLVVHMKDQDRNNNLVINNLAISIDRASIDELLLCFNFRKISWKFKSIFEKVLILLMEESKVELIFSYYPNEKSGLQTIQTCQSF